MTVCEVNQRVPPRLEEGNGPVIGAAALIPASARPTTKVAALRAKAEGKVNAGREEISLEKLACK